MEEINDKRPSTDFKGMSFSGFKKTDVRRELIQSVLSSKIEPSCYWIAELICAGHYKDLWDYLIHIYIKYIHGGNPKMAVYLELRMNHFIEIVRNGYSSNELALRNNIKIRKLFCEIVTVLCLSNRKHAYEEVKITKLEFDLTKLGDKLVSPSIDFAQPVFKKDDPKELFIAVNELMYALSPESKNTINGCHWVGWIIEYEIMRRNKKTKLVSERRSYIKEDKFQKNIIWIVWDCFFHYTENDPMVHKIVRALLSLFMLKYTGDNKKRIFILYYIISMITEKLDYNTPVVNDSNKVETIVDNVSTVYKQIKQNEISPETDYLFKNVKTNLDKTVEKLNTMTSLEKFVPRIF
jgi:hypothetical protein